MNTLDVNARLKAGQGGALGQSGESSPGNTELEAVPQMISAGNRFLPEAPPDLESTGVATSVLSNLALKLANTTPQFTTDWAARELKLPLQLVEQLYWQLKQDKLMEVLGQVGTFNYRYATTERGREFGRRLLEISGYVGPAPVSLSAYTRMLRWCSERHPPVELAGVRQALAELVIPEHAVRVAALAAASGRSLFLFGPPGNGKTSVGQSLFGAMLGELWIPYCIAIEDSVIRIYDPQSHKQIDGEHPQGNYDRRWIRVHRPLIVAGGEMTLDELDLIFSPGVRFYESPPHIKANGGIFLIDDFGRQRMEPHELLNRWIVPLERRIDFLTLLTGQKIEVPFELMLVVATNLTVSDVADPAFLRRMGYRLHLDRPTAEQYREIFQRYAQRVDVDAPADVIDRLLSRYESEGRELRCSEPKDLIERARDICGIYDKPFHLNSEVLDLAWDGYFGNMT
jgi:hypothetical protein